MKKKFFAVLSAVVGSFLPGLSVWALCVNCEAVNVGVFFGLVFGVFVIPTALVSWGIANCK